MFHSFFSKPATRMTDKLILALDVDHGEQALRLVRSLKPHLSLFKVGRQLFTREGPETVAHAVSGAAELDVRYVTVHASGGPEMLQAAHLATKGSRTEILAVTVLTSLDDRALEEIGFGRSAAEQVVHLAGLVAQTGVKGLVCSPHEIELIRAQIPQKVTLVTPGVRSGAEGLQDQKRTLSAAEALKRGADHLVIGRPITRAADPVEATRRLMAECGLA
jgi:orotidine-5'-phosphate decarboxylase